MSNWPHLRSNRVRAEGSINVFQGNTMISASRAPCWRLPHAMRISQHGCGFWSQRGPPASCALHRVRWDGREHDRCGPILLIQRGPRKIAVAGNRGHVWGEQHRIKTRTKRNHWRVNSGPLTISGNYSRSPQPYWREQVRRIDGYLLRLRSREKSNAWVPYLRESLARHATSQGGRDVRSRAPKVSF